MNCPLICLQVLSAYQLPKIDRDTLNPYVKVEVIGVPEDNETNRTPYRKSEGFHPIWNYYCSFDIRVPALALLRFSVFHHEEGKDPEIGSFTIRAEAMRLGLRTVPLYKPGGIKDIFARLFVIVKLEDGAGNPANWDHHYPDLDETSV